MDIGRALKIRDRALSRATDIYGRAECFGSTSATINKEWCEMLEWLNGLKVPRWIQAYLDGWRKAKTEQLYAQQLVFGGMVDGVFYSTHRDRADYYEKNGIEPREYADDGKVKERGHYWRPQEHRPLRPFFLD